MTDDTTKAPEGGLGSLRPSDCVPGGDEAKTVRVFLDCDGVLADFDTYAHDYFGMNPREYERQVGSAKFWADLEAKGDFYRNLPLMPDAMALYEGVKHLNPVILTGCPRGNWAEAQKVAWAAEHFPGVPVITCRSSDKRAHAKPGDVLIDDWHQHRHRWVEMGGVWISHTCAETSLAALWAHYPHLHPKAQAGTEKPSGFGVDNENHEALRSNLSGAVGHELRRQLCHSFRHMSLDGPTLTLGFSAPSRPDVTISLNPILDAILAVLQSEGGEA